MESQVVANVFLGCCNGILQELLRCSWAFAMVSQVVAKTLLIYHRWLPPGDPVPASAKPLLWYSRWLLGCFIDKFTVLQTFKVLSPELQPMVTEHYTAIMSDEQK